MNMGLKTMCQIHSDLASFPYCLISSIKIYSANNHNKPVDQMTVSNTSPRTKSELNPEFTSEKQQTEVSEVRHLHTSSCTVMTSICTLWLSVCVQNIRLKKRRLQRVSRILGTRTGKLHSIIRLHVHINQFSVCVFICRSFFLSFCLSAVFVLLCFSV